MGAAVSAAEADTEGMDFLRGYDRGVAAAFNIAASWIADRYFAARDRRA